jgi:hypothetical protein
MLTMGPQTLLKLVAETKSEKQITLITNKIKEMFPHNFYHGDQDPALKERVFFHAPNSAFWSGRAISKEKV